jgi:hypothetical protein
VQSVQGEWIKVDLREERRGAGPKRQYNPGLNMEYEGERRNQPPGITNVRGSCYIASAIHVTAWELGYNQASNTTLWEHQRNWQDTPRTLTTREVETILDLWEHPQASATVQPSRDAAQAVRSIRRRSGHAKDSVCQLITCRCGYSQEKITEEYVIPLSQLDILTEDPGAGGSQFVVCDHCNKWVARKEWELLRPRDVIYIESQGQTSISVVTTNSLHRQIRAAGQSYLYALVGLIMYCQEDSGGVGHYYAARRMGTDWWKCDDDHIEQSSLGSFAQGIPTVLVYQWTSGTVPMAIILQSELVRADQAIREVENWMRSSQTGPGGWNRVTSWTPRQHWDRAKSLSVMAPERIKQLLDLWPQMKRDCRKDLKV